MRKIIHCDADCFFAALEMREDPALRGRPVAVGSSTEGRGVIATCNYEARTFGVHSAMPSAQARRLCPDLIIVPHNMALYREASQQMRDIFHSYTEQVQPLSLDEAFLDVSHCQRYRGSATLIARELRQRVADKLGITISAGVAPNKFLAKVASDWCKPDGLTVVPPEEVADFVQRLPVKRIFGVGRVTAQKLERMGVRTCGELQGFSEIELARRFGSMGLRLYELCRGIDERPVQSVWRRKSLSVEHTYPRDLPSLDACLGQLPSLFQQLQARQRRLDAHYRVVKAFVKVKFNDFVSTTLESIEVGQSLEDYRQLCSQAWQRGDRPVRLLGLGVRLVDLKETGSASQLNLFPELAVSQ